MKERLKLWVWLAWVNLFISSFTFGGGYVVVPMVRKYFVEKKKLFQEEELMEMAAIAQSTPGAIAINLSSLAGYKVAGAAGMAISSVCALVPPLVILSVVSLWYEAVASNTLVTAVLKGMQAGVAALIVDFVVDMTNAVAKEKSMMLDIMIVISFFVAFFTQINVILILLICGLVCIVRVWMKQRHGKMIQGES